MTKPQVTLIQGDFRNQLQQLQESNQTPVDLILMDPPYGTIKGAGIKTWDENTTKWDNKIPIKDIITAADQLLRKKGKLLVFAKEPFTSELITQNTNHEIEFNYKYTWEKNHFGNPLNSKKAPVHYTEDIVVFTKQYTNNFDTKLRNYFRKLYEYIPTNTKKQIHQTLGHQGADHCFRYDSPQFDLPTKKTYNELKQEYNIHEMDGFIEYETLEQIRKNNKPENVFRLPKNENKKPNLLKYDIPTTNEGYHPTQKPVPLLTDLIKTYTYEDDTVIDLTMGSASTGVAAVKNNRNFIGIEKNPEYYETAKTRIQKHLQNKTLTDY